MYIGSQASERCTRSDHFTFCLYFKAYRRRRRLRRSIVFVQMFLRFQGVDGSEVRLVRMEGPRMKGIVLTQVPHKMANVQ